ncbi:polymorphic toxin-type HINT domain-containing protein [Kitasatospora sp. NPDC001539]|uniref:polymorphic toxin-type HINT domain-containing protein n=1 Tax=Kitasatospora sp. NPDC001539 TaxID=3154384 RepID=UPI0033256631
MADGSSKRIDQVRIGDQITNAVPGQDGTQTHTVTSVVVTTTDHDFADVTITPTRADKASKEHTSPTRTPQAAQAKQAKQDGIPLGKRIWQRAGLALAVSIAAVTLIGVNHQAAETTAPVAYSAPAISTAGDTAAPAVSADGGTIHATFHHPFYDQTQAAFVDAEDLRPGDVLQTPTGTAQVTGVHLFHADTTTYDFTVGDLHTYFVEAGSTPVLVHNVSLPCPEALEAGLQKAKDAHGRFREPGGMSGHTELDNGVTSNLSSGGDGRNLRPDWEAPPGTPDKNFHHLENQTAALMRSTGAREGYLYLHKAEGAAYGPCPGVTGYLENMRAILPEGAKLMVIWRNAAGRIENRVHIGGAD